MLRLILEYSKSFVSMGYKISTIAPHSVYTLMVLLIVPFDRYSPFNYCQKLKVPIRLVS